MRIFIAFILLCVFHLSSAVAAKHESNAVIYKTIKKNCLNYKQSSIFSKKGLHSFAKEPFSDSIARINQNTGNRQVSIAINDIFSIYDFAPLPNKTLTNFKNTIIYSDQFIFNCLYPKHTFW